jgi:beta-lactamase regulating signal transducer with metallopeptidase domain
VTSEILILAVVGLLLVGAVAVYYSFQAYEAWFYRRELERRYVDEQDVDVESNSNGQ